MWLGLSALLVAAVLGSVLAGNPLAQVFQEWADGTAHLADTKNGRVLSVNGAVGAADLSIPLPDAAGKNIRIVQRDGHSYAVVDGKVLYALDDPTRSLKSQQLKAGREILTGGGHLYAVDRRKGRRADVTELDPKELTPKGEAVQFRSEISAQVGGDGSLAALDVDRGKLSFVRDGAASSPLDLGPTATGFDLALVDGEPTVLNISSGVVFTTRRHEIGAELDTGLRNTDLLVGDVFEGELLVGLVESERLLLEVDTERESVRRVVVGADVAGSAAPLVSKDGVYLPNPVSGVLLKVNMTNGDVIEVDPDLGKGAENFEAFVKDGYLYVNNPGGPNAAIIRGTEVTVVEKYREHIPVVTPDEELIPPDPPSGALDDPDSPSVPATVTPSGPGVGTRPPPVATTPGTPDLEGDPGS